MENTRFHKHWSATEIRIAKKALKKANGNQKKAANAVYEELGRPLPSTIHKMYQLAKKHPRLRRKYFKKLKDMKLEPETMATKMTRRMYPTSSPVVQMEKTTKAPRIEVHGDHIRIYL